MLSENTEAEALMPEQTIRFQAELPTRMPRIERRVWVRALTDREVCCQKMPGLATAESDTGWLGATFPPVESRCFLLGRFKWGRY
jgi:hypothetical protein